MMKVAFQRKIQNAISCFLAVGVFIGNEQGDGDHDHDGQGHGEQPHARAGKGGHERLRAFLANTQDREHGMLDGAQPEHGGAAAEEGGQGAALLARFQ